MAQHTYSQLMFTTKAEYNSLCANYLQSKHILIIIMRYRRLKAIFPALYIYIYIYTMAISLEKYKVPKIM